MINRITVDNLLELLDEVAVLATQVQAQMEAEDYADSEYRMRCPYYGAPKLTGALRRRSMDLTRLLAELRRS